MAGPTPARRGRQRKTTSNRRRVARPRPSLAELGSALRGALSRRRKAIAAVLAFIVLLAGGVGAAHWLTTSPRFAIERVNVGERQWLSDDALATRLAIDDHPNLFLFDTGAAAERLLASPWVREAAVRRSFPDGLDVEVIENVPAAVVVLEDLYLIDADGRPFKRTSAAEIAGFDLLVITGISRQQASSEPETTAERLAEALGVADRWNANSDRPPASEINIDPVRGFSVVPATGAPTIRLGTDDDNELEARLVLFDRAWASLDEQERARTHHIHLDRANPPTRVALAITDP